MNGVIQEIRENFQEEVSKVREKAERECKIRI